MAFITKVKQIDCLIRKKENGVVTLYTTPALSYHRNYLYCNNKNVEFKDNPFKIIQLKFYWKEVTDEVGVEIKKLHIESSMNLVSQMYRVNKECVSWKDVLTACYGIDYINDHHLVLAKQASEFDRILPYLWMSSAFPNVWFFTTKKEALHVSLTEIYRQGKDFFSMIRNAAKRKLISNKCKDDKWKVINLNYHNFNSSVEAKDIMRLYKIMFMSHRIYNSAFKEFKNAIDKNKNLKNGYALINQGKGMVNNWGECECLKIKDMEEYMALLKWERLYDYMNLLYKYHLYNSDYRFASMRNRYFDNMKFKHKITNTKKIQKSAETLA